MQGSSAAALIRIDCRAEISLPMMSDRGPGAHAADLELLARIAAGDRQAFHAFYQRYAARVLAYVRQLTRDRAPVDDIVQEVFIAVWRKAASYRVERGDPAGWLYTITRNKLVDSWRRHGKGAETDTAEPETTPVASAAPTSDLRLDLDQALARLSRDQREAVEMAYFGGLTYEETAQRLQLPLGTLKSRIRAGLMSMRATLEAG